MDVLAVLRTGNQNRKVGSTDSNAHSSRSHAILLVSVVSKNSRTRISRTAQLYLVDLAGSEKVKKTNATGQRLAEAQKINQSLSSLGLVIFALSNANKAKTAFIPYRNSKLTRLLETCFGGNARSALLINCSPASYNDEETLSTLRFGERAQMIRNKPVVNADMSREELKALLQESREAMKHNEESIQELLGKIEAAKQKLADMKSAQKLSPLIEASAPPAKITLQRHMTNLRTRRCLLCGQFRSDPVSGGAPFGRNQLAPTTSEELAAHFLSDDGFNSRLRNLNASPLLLPIANSPHHLITQRSHSLSCDAPDLTSPVNIATSLSSPHMKLPVSGYPLAPLPLPEALPGTQPAVHPYVSPLLKPIATGQDTSRGAVDPVTPAIRLTVSTASEPSSPVKSNAAAFQVRQMRTPERRSRANSANWHGQAPLVPQAPVSVSDGSQRSLAVGTAAAGQSASPSRATSGIEPVSPEESAAASAIQKTWRGKQAQKNEKAALAIQKNWRGRQTRREVQQSLQMDANGELLLTPDRKSVV